MNAQKIARPTEAQLRRLLRRQLQRQRHKIKPTAKRARRSRRMTSPFALPIPGWNERRMTSADFRRTCERERIVVICWRLPDGFQGVTYRQRGQPVIWINSQLRGEERLFVEFHELGHYFLHRGGSLLNMSKKGTTALSDWHEVEANTCGAIALCRHELLSEAMNKLSRALLKRSRKGGAR